MVGRLEDFLAQQGLGEGLRTPLMIEAFVAIGLSGHASSTRGTYRSVLREGEGNTAHAPAYAGSHAPAPYAEAERAELFSVARSQRRDWKRHSALSLLALSIGAGLRAGEILATRRRDIVHATRRTSAGTVRLIAPGARSRTITIRPPYGQLLVELSLVRGEGFLFHPEPADRSYPNFISDFTARLARDPSAPRFSVSRGRSSFLCDQLERATPLDVLLKEAGIAEVESLLRYARHVPCAPQSKAELRARLREQTSAR